MVKYEGHIEFLEDPGRIIMPEDDKAFIYFKGEKFFGNDALREA